MTPSEEKECLERLKIDQAKLEEYMSTQASWYAHYAVLAAKADDTYERAKMQRKTVEAELDFQIRTALSQANEKATDKAVESRVQIDPKFKEVVEQMFRAQLNANIMGAIVESFRSRGQMLSSLGAMKRAEMEQTTFLGTPAVKDMAQTRMNAANAALKQQFFDNLGQAKNPPPRRRP